MGNFRTWIFSIRSENPDVRSFKTWSLNLTKLHTDCVSLKGTEMISSVALNSESNRLEMPLAPLDDLREPQFVWANIIGRQLTYWVKAVILSLLSSRFSITFSFFLFLFRTSFFPFNHHPGIKSVSPFRPISMTSLSWVNAYYIGNMCHTWYCFTR